MAATKFAEDGGVGSELILRPGDWTGGPTLTYQWLRCAPRLSGCPAIPGATGTTYVVTADDRGKTLRARVTATNSAGSSTKTSPESKVIAG